MEYFKWEESLKTGISMFDDDHKILIKLINDLHSGLLSGFSISEMTYILDDLVRYTNVHFKREEEMLKKHSYPEYEKHKTEHTALIAQVVDFQDQFREGKKSFSLHLMGFLKEWLVNHIMKTDLRYGAFFKEQNIQ